MEDEVMENLSQQLYKAVMHLAGKGLTPSQVENRLVNLVDYNIQIAEQEILAIKKE